MDLVTAFILLHVGEFRIPHGSGHLLLRVLVVGRLGTVRVIQVLGAVHSHARVRLAHHWLVDDADALI
jgi:hypothetical protein